MNITGYTGLTHRLGGLGTDSLKGFLIMLLAAFLFAILGLLIKLLGPSYRVWDIAVYRFYGGFVFLLLFFGRQQKLFKPRQPRLMLVRGITGSIAFVSLVLAIRNIPLSTAMVFFYSYPAFAALFSPLIFKDRISLVELMLVGLALLGVAVLLDFQAAVGVFGQLMGLVSGIFAGLTVAIIKSLRTHHSSVSIYFYFCLIGGLLATGPFAADPQIPRISLDWAIVGGIVLASVFAQLLMNQGFTYCKSWEGGLFMTSEVVFTSIFGFVFLGETAGWRFWLGGSMIIASAVAFNVYSRRMQQVKAAPVVPK